MNEGFRHEPAEGDVKVEAGNLTSRDIGRVVRYPDGDGVLDQIIHDGEDVWVDLKSDSANFSWDHRNKPDQILTLSADKSTTIATVEELDALPDGSVVLSKPDIVCQKSDECWVFVGNESDYLATDVTLPARVIHWG